MPAPKPVLACIYAPETAFSGLKVAAAVYIIDLVPPSLTNMTTALPVERDTAAGSSGEDVLPALGPLAGIRSLLEDGSKCKFILGCAKVRRWNLSTITKIP